jgi:hypothetical protein
LDQVLTCIHYKYDFSITIAQKFVALSLLNTLGSSFSFLNTSAVSLQNLLSFLFLILLPITWQNQKKGKHQVQRYIYFFKAKYPFGRSSTKLKSSLGKWGEVKWWVSALLVVSGGTGWWSASVLGGGGSDLVPWVAFGRPILGWWVLSVAVRRWSSVGDVVDGGAWCQKWW